MEDYKVLPKTHTGLACEFFVAGELTRRGYNVTLTLGNTKAIDLLIEKEGELRSIQVKGIQRTKSITWNFSLSKLKDGIIYILVNLHADSLIMPEYYVLSYSELIALVKSTKSNRDYLDYTTIKENPEYLNRWDKI